MESLGAYLLSLAKTNSLLTILVVVALALGLLHEQRIGIDILALLIRHIKAELARSATSFGGLGEALSTRERPAADEWQRVQRRRRKRKFARQVAWLRRQTHRHRPRRGFFPRHARRNVY